LDKREADVAAKLKQRETAVAAREKVASEHEAKAEALIRRRASSMRR
jgi:hypothetical protein